MIVVMAVNYHSADAVVPFVHSLVEQTYQDWRCTVVDNGDTAEGASQIEALVGDDSRLTLLRPGCNIGYFGGARHAFNQWNAGHDSPPEWTVVSNVDIRLSSPDFFQRLSGIRTDVVAPSVVSTLSGRDVNPHLVARPSVSQVRRNALVNRYRVIGQLAGLYQDFVAPRIHGRQAVEPVQRDIYAPHGSLICFHRRYFEAGGTLNHGVFLFGEEISVGEQALVIGARVTYVPSLEAEHSEHVSTGIWQSRQIAVHGRVASQYVNQLISQPSRHLLPLLAGQGGSDVLG